MSELGDKIRALKRKDPTTYADMQWDFALDRAAALADEHAATTLQRRVEPWMQACFGAEISADKLERGDRFLEEVFELLQSGDYPRERVAALEEYVWSRDVGEPHQEVGGVMITLAAYCLAHGLDMHRAGEDELARIWTKVEKIRAKHAAKPQVSALLIATTARHTGEHAATVASGLQDPVAIHANMLRGTIAKPSWEQIKHLYPDAFKATVAAAYEAAAQKAEAFDAKAFRDRYTVDRRGRKQWNETRVHACENQAINITAEDIAEAIRAMTDADAAAALARIKAEAHREGMREAAGMLHPDMFQNWYRCEGAKRAILDAAGEAGNG